MFTRSVWGGGETVQPYSKIFCGIEARLQRLAIYHRPRSQMSTGECRNDTRAELLALQKFFAIQNATVLVNGCLCVLHGQEFVGSYEWYDELLHDCDGGSNNHMYVTRNLSKQRPRFP